MRTRLIFPLPAIVASVFFVGGAIAVAPLPMQTNSQAAVTIKVTPRDLAAPVWVFDVVFDTHSQALTDDLGKTAALVPDGGVPQAPLKWEADAPGGHHRKGVLQFKSISPMPASIRIQFQRSGESAPRSFRWELK